MTLCLMLYLPFPAFATSIVTIIAERSITIAADSVLLGNSRETGNLVRTSVCKIRCVDRLCFAASGRYNLDTIKYNVWKLAEKELHRAGTPKEVSERFKGIIDPLIPRLVAASKKETPQRYDEWLKGGPVLAYLFAGFDRKGESLIVTGEVKIDAEGHPQPIQESVWHGEAGKATAVLLGWHEHIADLMKRQPEWAASAAMHPSEFAERMVQVEIQASENTNRRDVGEPIAIVSLTDADGFNLESRGTCQDQQ
jgi:hypothetical protein